MRHCLPLAWNALILQHTATHCNTLNHMLEKGLVLWGMFCYTAERGSSVSAAFCTQIHTHVHTHVRGALLPIFVTAQKESPPRQQMEGLLQRRKCCLLQHRKEALSQQQITTNMRVYVCVFVYMCVHVCVLQCAAGSCT